MSKQAQHAINALHQYEREIFEEIVGIGARRPWGAAVGAAREALVGAGLLVSALHDALTPLGRECRRLVLTESAEEYT